MLIAGSKKEHTGFSFVALLICHAERTLSARRNDPAKFIFTFA
jgi:hypothetical protein